MPPGTSSNLESQCYQSTSSALCNVDSSVYTIITLYKFVSPIVEECQATKWKEEIEQFLCCEVGDVKGLVLVSVEGVNGTICSPKTNCAMIKQFFEEKFPDLFLRLSFSPHNVFYRFKIKIRPEIVTLGPVLDNDEYLRPYQKGEYVKPGKAWDNLLADPDCLVIDTRNAYEAAIGSFSNAVQPETTEFREFPSWLRNNVLRDRPPKKIAMFCTGGIRCEKSTALCLRMLRQKAIEDVPVYHLEGGILAYLDTVPASESQFHGECFVFDKRTAVSHGLAATTNYVSCHACRLPVHKQDTTLPTYQEGVSCPNCFEQRSDRRQRYEDRQKQFSLGMEPSGPRTSAKKDIA